MLVGAVDFEFSSAFCRDTLASRWRSTWTIRTGGGTLFRASGGGLIEILKDRPHHPFGFRSGVDLHCDVDGVGGSYERVVNAGIGIVDPGAERPWGRRTFEMRDPSGLALVFTPFPPSNSTSHER